MSVAASVGVVGVHRPVPRDRSAIGPVTALIACLALTLALLAATGTQVGAAARQLGRPTLAADVVACPGLDGGPCTVRVERAGTTVDLPLADGAMVLAQPGDRLPVAVDEAGTADPAGARPWLAVGAFLVLLAGAFRSSLRWGRRAMNATALDYDEWARAAGLDLCPPLDGPAGLAGLDGADAAPARRAG